MPPITREISADEVHRLVDTDLPPETTDELAEFGKLLVDETERRTQIIDSKATLIIGYGSAILAFLLTQRSGNAPTALVVLIVLAAAGAILRGFLAIRMHDWKWFSDKDWFSPDLLNHPDKFRRFHIETMHLVRQHNNRVNNRRATHLWHAQYFLGGAAVLSRWLCYGGAYAFSSLFARCPAQGEARACNPCAQCLAQGGA